MNMALNSLPSFRHSLAWLAEFMPHSPATPVIVKPIHTDIQRGAIWELPRPMGFQIECLNGTVWITHDGDCKDIVLEAGQSHTVDSHGRILAYALETAQLIIRPT